MVVVYLSVTEVWKELARGVSRLGGVDGRMVREARMRRDRKYVDVLVRVGRL